MGAFRTCDSCGTKMPFGRRRNKVGDQMLCDGCTPGKPGQPGRPIGMHGQRGGYITGPTSTTDLPRVPSGPTPGGSSHPTTMQGVQTMAVEADLEHCQKCGAEIGDAGLVRTGGLLRCGDGCKTASYDEGDDADYTVVSVKPGLGVEDPSADFRGFTSEGDARDFASNQAADGYDGEIRSGASVIDTFEANPTSRTSRTSGRHVAHDSGDGQTIYHCPFCFAGDVRYLTRDGIKSFAETSGTSQWVLTADPNQRTAGRWVQAEVKEFGEQSLMKVTLRRNKRTRVIEATPEHRWLVKSDKRVVGVQARSTDRDVLTRDLRPGQRLSYLRAPGLPDEVTLDKAGIRHGVVFGDGSAQGKTASVSLWGEKDKQLLQFFPDRRYRDVNTSTRVLGTGVPGVHVTGDLWAWMKTIPDTDDKDYLYGWLAGYFAADGTVSKQGQIVINSANLAHLEAVRDVALRLGITTYDITRKMRVGFLGREPSALYGLEFVGSTLREDFFLIEEQRNRFLFRNYGFERIGWTVVSLEATTKVETVYCAVVPGTHTFALEGNIWVGNCGAGQVTARSDGTVECGFCHTCFTVQVQPLHSSMPQTIDGVPVNDPSMPGDGTHTDVPPAPAQDPASPSAPADASEPGDGFAPAGSGGKDGFAQAGSEKAAFRTATGAALDEEAYIRYLAIAFADDKDAVLDEVRASRGVR